MKSKKIMIAMAVLIAFMAIEFTVYASTSWQYPGYVTKRPRSEWGASAPKNPLNARGTNRNYVVFHHTGWNFSDTSLSACKAEIKEVQDYHMNNNGWDDIGYHYLVDPEGRVWEGRDKYKEGSHTYGYNDNLGVCVLGDFEGWIFGIGLQTMTTKAYNGMRDIAAFCVWWDDIDLPYGIKGHKDLGSTACPGKNMYPKVKNDLVTYLQQNMVKN